MEKSWVKPVSLFIIYRHTGSVQCQLCDPEVVGLIYGRVISKNFKMIPAVILLGAQH